MIVPSTRTGVRAVPQSGQPTLPFSAIFWKDFGSSQLSGLRAKTGKMRPSPRPVPCSPVSHFGLASTSVNQRHETEGGFNASLHHPVRSASIQHDSVAPVALCAPPLAFGPKTKHVRATRSTWIRKLIHLFPMCELCVLTAAVMFSMAQKHHNSRVGIGNPTSRSGLLPHLFVTGRSRVAPADATRPLTR